MADGCRLSCASRRDVITSMSGAMLAALVGGDVLAATGTYRVDDMTGVAVGPPAKSYPLPAADGVTIDKTNGVILVRYQGRVIAFNLACPHENTALRWKRGALKFECPKHDSRYTPDGAFIDGRATRHMDRLAIRRDGESAVVDLSSLIKSDADPAAWAAAVITLS